MKKINYSTNYANNETINGYVMATDHGDYYTITKSQYKRACDKLSIVGTTPNFQADKRVYVIGIDL